MLKLSKKIDYGLIAMNYMVSHRREGSINVKRIAAEHNIPAELLAKVLQRLAKKGLVASHSGPKGGYALAKAPAHITVAEVVEAIEGPIRIADCYMEATQEKGVSRCLQMDRCNIRTPVEQIQASIIQVLEGMTMAQIHYAPEAKEKSVQDIRELFEKKSINIT